ncbi:MAG TPA: beta-ketoacyl-[acyl-carrier-protein] synthase family protein [Gammaproteobacteria bacterium]|nr:beta-ketoacyl-[acyl-carrier-protein] synthase family protein [Gammaproteobacteria bacterium]
MQPLTINDYTLVTALGAGRAAQRRALLAGETGLAPCRFFDITDLPTFVGEVAGLDEVTLPTELAEFDCRNNRLAWLALQQDGFTATVAGAADRYGPDRIGVYVGTSTAGIHHTELAYFARASIDAPLPGWYRYDSTHNMYSVAEFVRLALGLNGISMAISTACSSSAKVFASAERAMAGGLIDAAVVGGADSLCLTTLYGFHSLQLVADELCRPADAARRGLNIGEAAGFALLERDGDPARPKLLGYGESGDAYHMSSPCPDGAGALLAMGAALRRAALASDDIDYINLHGTGTKTNDLAECTAVQRLFGPRTPCSSTKGWTGHTLGAAGIVEIAFSLLALEHGFMPQSLNTREVDPAITCRIVTETRHAPLGRVLSNSFGFGGSNCSLIVGAGA